MFWGKPVDPPSGQGNTAEGSSEMQGASLVSATCQSFLAVVFLPRDLKHPGEKLDSSQCKRDSVIFKWKRATAYR